MANPSGRTYHWAEHNSLSDPHGPHIVYKDGGRGRPNSPTGPTAGGEVGNLLSRYPVVTVLVGLAAGFLTARFLSACCRG